MSLKYIFNRSGGYNGGPINIGSSEIQCGNITSGDIYGRDYHFTGGANSIWGSDGKIIMRDNLYTRDIHLGVNGNDGIYSDTGKVKFFTDMYPVDIHMGEHGGDSIWDVHIRNQRN